MLVGWTELMARSMDGWIAGGTDVWRIGSMDI